MPFRNEFTPYQDSLHLTGMNDYGPVTAENLKDYLLKVFLVPAANKAYGESTPEQRAQYLIVKSIFGCAAISVAAHLFRVSGRKLSGIRA